MAPPVGVTNGSLYDCRWIVHTRTIQSGELVWTRNYKKTTLSYHSFLPRWHKHGSSEVIMDVALVWWGIDNNSRAIVCQTCVVGCNFENKKHAHTQTHTHTHKDRFSTFCTWHLYWLIPQTVCILKTDYVCWRLINKMEECLWRKSCPNQVYMQCVYMIHAPYISKQITFKESYAAQAGGRQ